MPPLSLFKITIFIIIQILFLVSLHQLLQKEITVHSLDDTIQHQNFVDLSRTLQSIDQNYFTQTKQIIFHSIQNDDYNQLSVLPLAVLNRLSSNLSRNRFIALTYIVYYLPCFFLFYSMAKKINNKRVTGIGYVLCNLIFFANPIILLNLISGQSTIDGVLIILIIMHLYIDSNYGEKISILKLTIIGLLLGLLPILHRWYSFFSLSFLGTYFLNNVFIVLTKRLPGQFVTKYLETFYVAILSLYTFVALSGNLWQKYTHVDFSKTYQYFKYSNNIFTSVHQTFTQIGYLSIFMFILTTIYFYKRNSKHISLFIIFIITTISFLNVQNFSIHHLYLIFIPIFLPIASYFLNAKMGIQSVLFVLILFFITLNTFFYKSPFLKKLGILPNTYYQKPHNNTRLINQVTKYLSYQLDAKNIYILSANYYYNTSSFRYHICTLTEMRPVLCSKIVFTPHIRSRDPLPEEFFKSDYILSILPDDNNETAITVVRQFILDNPTNYQKIPINFSDNKYQITIYKMIEPLSESQTSGLLQTYNN